MTKEQMIIDIIKNLRNLFSIIKKRSILSKKSNNGILFPVRVIDIKIKNKDIKKNINIFFFEMLFFRNGSKNIKNKENRCKYPPAINSSPKKPEILLAAFIFIPKRFFSILNCKITSIQRTNVKTALIINKYFILKIFLSIIILTTRNKSKYRRKKKDLYKLVSYLSITVKPGR